MDQPREIDMDAVDCSAVLLESIEDLQYKMEELQCFCDDRERKNQELQQRLIDKEREYRKNMRLLNEELTSVRQTKIRIARENVMKECAVAPRWFNSLTKSIEQEKTIADLTNQVNELKLEIMEKSKTSSSLEHQLTNAEATITVLTSDRNRMAVEVDELALRLEEMEYGSNFQTNELDRNQVETASFNSYEDEAMSYSDKNSGVLSRTSYQSEEDSDGFVSLKRVANFSNINTLDESAVFREEHPIVSEKVNVVSPHSGYQLKEVVVTDENENIDKRSSADPLENPDANSVEDKLEKVKDSPAKCDTYGKREAGLLVHHKDSSWERFERLESLAVLSNGREESDRSFVVKEEESGVFNRADRVSPFLKLVESTPVNNGDTTKSEAKSNGCLDEPDDPWISPCVSPIAEKKNKDSSRNLFWEKNLDCTIYPFYIPDSHEEEEVTGGDKSEDVCPDLNVGIPTNNSVCFGKSHTEKVDIKSPTSPSCNVSFDEQAVSFVAEANQKPTNIIAKKPSKDNLWDFEPDSIVDVSTGQTIYESMRRDDDSQASENEATTRNEETPKADDLSCLAKYLPREDHVRSMSDLTSEMSEEKAKAMAKTFDRRTSQAAESHGDGREVAKKSSRKEREALKAYMQWKVRGKQGIPPANFKISLC